MMKLLHTYVATQAAKSSTMMTKVRLIGSGGLALFCVLMIFTAKSTQEMFVAIGMAAGLGINAWLAVRILEVQKRKP